MAGNCRKISCALVLLAGFAMTSIGVAHAGSIAPMRPDFTRPDGLPGEARDIARARAQDLAPLLESKRSKKKIARKKKSSRVAARSRGRHSLRDGSGAPAR